MRIEYDREADAVYIYLQEEEVSRTIELSHGVNIDLDAQDRLIGIEVLDATQYYSLSDIFNLRTENFVLDESLLARQSNDSHSLDLHDATMRRKSMGEAGKSEG